MELMNELRFNNIALRETQHGGSTPEDDTTGWDDMYENVSGQQPPRENRSPPEPAVGRSRQLRAGIRKYFLHLSLVSVLLCLVLLMTVIGLAVKYVRVSSNLQQAVISHQTMSSSLTQSLRSKEELQESVRKKLMATESELEEIRQELEKTQQNMEKVHLELETMIQNNMDLNSSLTQSLRRGEELLASMRTNLTATKMELEKAVKSSADVNDSLLQCLQNERTSATHRQQAEVTLNGVRSELGECLAEKKGLCPEGWVLFRMKCLWFSWGSGSWQNGKEDCERKDSNLLTVQKDTTALQHFLDGERREFWVGKELIWNSGRQEWKWPEPHQSLWQNRCLVIRGRDLWNIPCTERKWWICEKNLVLTSLKWNPYKTMKRLEFTLSNAEFYCSQKQN